MYVQGNANGNSNNKASVGNLNDARHNVMQHSHSSSMNMTIGVSGITNGLTNEQYEKLIFLLKNIQLQGTSPVVNQTMAYQATSNDALGKSSHSFSPL
ncbi:hypothetical protein M9H77_31640 [Catharanthus roseus]|uniref:Uncharacterized protein n=1 Tax=Catharanthus roseus TaxID=4058 RepID=A0ACC0A2Z7_CATRO|nr:hypothetical protein M9H77_31640 [Catharanthus roseus]